MGVRWATLCGLLCVLLAEGAAVSAQPRVELVAAIGDPIAGTDRTVLVNSADAVMNASGIVALHGRDTTSSGYSMWLWDRASGLREAMRADDLIDGVHVDARIPPVFPGPLAVDAAGLYARALNELIFRRAGGGPYEIIIERGAPCPTMPSFVHSPQALWGYTASGSVLFTEVACTRGLMFGTPSALTSFPLAEAPGFEASSPSARFVGTSRIFEARLSDSGVVWFSAEVNCVGDPACPSGLGVGLFRMSGGAPDAVLVAGTPAAGVSDGATYAYPGLLGTNAGDGALVLGSLRAPDGSITEALYAVRGSEAALVAREGEPAPGLDGDPFGSFGVPEARRAFLANDGSVVFLNAGAIWRWRPGGAPALLARTGDVPPGATEGWIGSLFRMVVSPAGRLAFVAEIEGHSSWSEVLFAEDATGRLEAVLVDNTPIDVGRAEPLSFRSFQVGRSPTEISTTGADGRGLFFSDRGSLLVHGNADTTFLVDLFEPPATVRLAGVEVVQTVQTLRNSVPLVAGKQAYLRAYVAADEPTRVRLRLRARRDGAELEHSPYEGNAIGALGIATPTPLADRSLLGGAFWFEIPPTWTDGDVELTVELHPESSALELRCEEAAGSTVNDCSVGVRFQRMPRLPVHWVQMQRPRPDGGEPTVEPATAVATLRRVLESVLPIASVDATSELAWGYNEGANNIDRMLTRLELHRDHSGCGARCRRLWQAYYPLRGEDLGGIASTGGFGSVTGYASSGIVRHRHAHEIGHNLGLPHAVHTMFGRGADEERGFVARGACTETADLGTPDYPYFALIDSARVATIGPTGGDLADEVWGLDLLESRVRDPRVNFELMSYCILRRPVSRWISDVTYRALFDAIRARFEGTEPPPGAPLRHYWIGGRITPAHAVELDPIRAYETADPPAPLPAGSTVIELRDAGGGILSTHAVEPRLGERDAALDPLVEEDRARSFFVSVPEEPWLAAIVVRRDGEELAHVRASASAPEVSLAVPAGGETFASETVPVAWTASDPDGDTLSYEISYSADDGVTWRPHLHSGPTTSHELPREALRGSTRARVRVDASDGLRVTSVTSAPFTVVGQPPVPTILSPIDGTLFAGSGTLFLTGDARDAEDGELLASTLSWSSDRDGALGVGSPLAIAAPDLSEGAHVITLRAVDASGMEATASIALRIAHAPPEVLHDLVLDGLAEPSPAIPGEPFTLALELANAGPDDARDVRVRVQLSEPLAWRADDPDAPDCAPEGTDLVCTVPTLARAERTTLALSLEAPAGTHAVRASIEPTDADPIRVNDRVELSLRVYESEEPPGSGGCDCTTVQPPSSRPVWGIAIVFFLGVTRRLTRRSGRRRS